MHNPAEPMLAPPASAEPLQAPVEPSSAPVAAASAPAEPPSKNPFAALGLREPLVRALADSGYLTPTPVQEQVIPSMLQGQDIIGQAQTGTGKTAAFGLPMLQGISPDFPGVQGLVLAPTRELAIQVGDALRTYAKHLGHVRICTLYGGQPIYRQLTELKRGADLVVATPGRLIDCIDRRALTLSTVRFVVLDEADEMLRMGFIEDVEKILAGVPEERHTALFSATMPEAIAKIARERLRNPVHVAVEQDLRSVEGTEQRVLLTPQYQKIDVLARLLDAEQAEAILVFAKTRLGCANLAERLDERGFASAALHGDMNQAQREDVVRRLRSGRLQLVVATDVAARGLDVDCISHVVNYDPPADSETYLHRIGRTGRAGRKGVAILLLTPKERWLQKTYERFSGRKMVVVRPPRNAEIAARRATRLEELVVEKADSHDLAPYRAVVERLVKERGLDPLDVGAVLARLATKDQPLVVQGPEPKEVRMSDQRDQRERSPGPPKRFPARRSGGGDFIRMFLPVGSRHGLRPADLVGALTRGGGLPPTAIGTIEVNDSVTFFEVDRSREKEVLNFSNKVELRGKPFRVTLARPDRRGGGSGFNRRPQGPPNGRGGPPNGRGGPPNGRRGPRFGPR